MALRALLTGSSERAATTRRPRVRGKSLAVLPFVNSSGDAQLEYLTDGITESIINSLSQLPGLRVVPRSLAFRYKGLQADPATVGLALNARTILTGHVVQHGDIAQHPGRARRHHHRVAAVGRAVPSEGRRPAAGPGGDRVADLRSAAAEADRRAEEEAAQASDRASRGLPGIHARPPSLAQLEPR